MKDDLSDDVYYKIAHTVTERIMYAVAGAAVGALFGFGVGRYAESEAVFWVVIILSVIVFGGSDLLLGKRFWRFVKKNWPYLLPW